MEDMTIRYLYDPTCGLSKRRFHFSIAVEWLNAQFSVLPLAKPITMLCHQRWETESILPSITDIPILFLSGLADEIVP